MQDFPPFHGRIFGGGGVGGAAATGRGGGLFGYPTLPSRKDRPPLPPVQCPRCDSTNTKFCYYNNYNLSHPRHFCKACRRYWTMGGVLRNVPVGGGCRKSKRPSKFTSPASHYKNPSRRRNPLSAVRSSVDDSTAAGSSTSDASTSDLLPDPSLLASQICVPNHNPQLGKLTNADLPFQAANIFETQSAGGFATTPSPLLGFIFPDPSSEREKAEAVAIGPGFADQTVPVDRQPASSADVLPSSYWDGPVEPTLFDLTGTVDPSSYWNQSHWSNADTQYLPHLGEICLTISLYQKDIEQTVRSISDDLISSYDRFSELTKGRNSVSSNGDTEQADVSEINEMDTLNEDKPNAVTFVDRVCQFFGGKNSGTISSTSRDVSPEKVKVSSADKISEEQTVDVGSDIPYDELLKSIIPKLEGVDMPAGLPGGILVDQSYSTAPVDLNSLLFSPSSSFWQSLADIQGTTGFQAGPWRLENGGESMKRVVLYTKAATKLVKAVSATEEQTYLKADGTNFAVLLSVSIPDVPFGSYFRTEILFCIMPGLPLPSEEQSSRLVISWRMNFLQSTMMKSMIENGARQGLKDSYSQFVDLLSQNRKPVDLKETAMSKEQILASLQTERESDWKLASLFFGNFAVISTVVAMLYVLIHIILANPSTIQGLEFPGIDLPDSIGEIVVCGVLVLRGQLFLNVVGRYLQALKQRGSDHGVKAQGDGWLLTVALIEGSSLAAVDSTGYSDPYVVFSCNGKTKTSSIKFQTLNPQWNEVFEFDAMDDPPSMMNVDVYDFDGPFDEATSLGHAEINFVKSNLSDLVDVRIPLQGNLAQTCQSKLLLRVFLNNTRGNDIVMEYITKMEKEVGKKIIVRSPQTNSTFQKLFGLPPEEFLINDFTCHLKRRMPTQGRIFLSPRIIGFHTNLFGHKTNFFFLWEDIDDIQLAPPSLATMGSPSVLIILRKGRGTDAKHGAKAVDPDGRLRFHFQSFVSFNVANRTIMALWKARALSPEQKMQLLEESGARNLNSEDSGSFLGLEDAKMSDVFSSAIDLDINSLMELFNGGPLEKSVMEKIGCVDYSLSPWETVRADVCQRQIHYKFDKNLSRYGGEVTSTQQKSPLPDKKGWLIEEVMALQGVLLGDYFNLHLRYQIEDLSPKLRACNVIVSLGIAWLKSTSHQKRITKNVISNSSLRLKDMFTQVENELLHAK